MADNETKQAVDSQVLNIGVSTWQNSLAQAVNETYSYANSSLFCAVVAGYYKDYAYRYIRPACQWLDGYVPSLHYGGSGIISTRVASSLINGMARTITGEKVLYKIIGEKTPEALETLKFVAKWGDKMEIKRAIKNGIGFALAIGTSLIKANRRDNGDVWLEAVRFDNCFYLANASNEVKEATFLLRSYTDTRDQNNQCQYFLAERRFWQYYKPSITKNADGTFTVVHKRGDRDAMVEYKVYRANSQSLNNMMATSGGRSSVNWSEIPLEIRKLIKEDYNLIRINEPQKLGFSNLAVEALLNDNGDISIPTGSNFGRGLIIPAIDDFIIYEIAESYAIRDMYNGKGTVYVPKDLSLGALGGAPINYNMAVDEKDVIKPTPAQDGEFKFDGGSITTGTKNPSAFIPTQMNPLEGMSDKYETIPGKDAQDQAVVVNQFNLRAQEWQLIQENALKRIAVKWGMSPKILASFLAQGQVQQTATQIDSEDDISIAFINQTRSNFKPAINRLIETVLNYYGKPHDVDIDFASPSIVNKDRILDRTTKKLEAGLIDIEDAIREINPDMDEETIQSKVDKAKQQQAMMMLAQQAEMNASGGFDNNFDDLGGENMKGTTSPRQN